MMVGDDEVLIRAHVQKKEAKNGLNDSSNDLKIKEQKKRSTQAFSYKPIKKLSLVGVTPAGHSCFQVFAKSHDRVLYRINLSEERVAARVADRCALQRNGMRAKTNFNYTRRELCQILNDIRHDVDQNIILERFAVTFNYFQPPELKD